MENLAQRVIRKLRERHFAGVARSVLDTPPVKARDDGLIIFSMIGSRVVAPYLIAAKSFHAHLGRGRFVILDDGTLTPADRDLLATHLDGPEIRAIADVDRGDCPKGGCWERLLTLLELRRHAYVIQLDSDTVTTGPVPEVAEAIAAGRSFTLRGDAAAELSDAAAFAEDLAALPEGSHIQALIEAVLHRIDAGLPRPLRYVRGCAGFAGFAPAETGRAVADAFSREAVALLGAARWAQWGSEQVMSNVIVANEPDPLLLPYDRYMNYWAEPELGPVSLVHFLGTCRYDRGCYPRVARAAVARLRRATA